MIHLLDVGGMIPQPCGLHPRDHLPFHILEPELFLQFLKTHLLLLLLLLL